MRTYIIDTDLEIVWAAGSTRAEAEKLAREYAAHEFMSVRGWYAVEVDSTDDEMTPALRAALRRRIEQVTGEKGSRALDALARVPGLALR